MSRQLPLKAIGEDAIVLMGGHPEPSDHAVSALDLHLHGTGSLPSVGSALDCNIVMRIK